MFVNVSDPFFFIILLMSVTAWSAFGVVGKAAFYSDTLVLLDDFMVAFELCIFDFGLGHFSTLVWRGIGMGKCIHVPTGMNSRERLFSCFRWNEYCSRLLDLCNL